MAIAPNTTFVAGTVLTAAQMNAFPFGICAYTEPAATATFTTEQVLITTSSFTAIANRYYELTYFGPNMSNTVGGAVTAIRFRLTNLAGAILGESYNTFSTAVGGEAVTATRVKTLTAGATVIVVTAQAISGTGTSYVDTNNKPYLLIKDIGPS